MKRFLFLLILSSFSLSCTLFANAQSTEDLDKILTVELSPEIPGPHETVDISIDSYTYDLSHAKISWYVNGALRASEIGKKTFSFTTGDSGVTSNIKYSIQTQEGENFDKTLTITPAEVNLIWESKGYTPPFYKGKTLFSFEGEARVVAVPNLTKPDGTKYKPEELVYTWKRGMGTDEEASGYGKNVFNFKGDIIARPTTIEVDVTNLNKTVQARGMVTINAVEPEIYVYQNDPSLGFLFNNAITDSFNLLGSEVSLVAMPFYFNNPDQEGIYSWAVNGNDAPEKSRFITFRNTTGETGYSEISIDLSNETRIMQSASSQFKLNFGNSDNPSENSLFKNIFGN